MEMHPLDCSEGQPDDVPEDVAILHSWANMEGAKYRDFSASRREYRAQMRHRAAENLRQMELQAQLEAETAAKQAEEAAAVAHARAEEATARLLAKQGAHSGSNGSKGMGWSGGTPDSREEQERLKAASLRSAAQQARKATMEREEGSKRARAAAFAESMARREEQEIVEAQASAIRQAAQYAQAGNRPRRTGTANLDEWLPGAISDPYSSLWRDEEETADLAHAQIDDRGWSPTPTAASTVQPPTAREESKRLDDPPLVYQANGVGKEPRSESPARSQAEVVYRLPVVAKSFEIAQPQKHSRGIAPAAVRTLVTEFSPIEALPETEAAPAPARKPDTTQSQSPVGNLQTAQRTSPDASLPQTSTPSLLEDRHPAPAWLYPLPQTETPRQQSVPLAASVASVSPRRGDEATERSNEPTATRWFGLRRVFGRLDAESEHEREPARETPPKTPILVVFSVAGGVGKTSLVATLGCALSRLGEKVLLADNALHSLLPFYFGSTKRLPGVVRMFCPPPEASGLPVHVVSYDATSQGDGVSGQVNLAEGLLANSHNAGRVLLDLGVSGHGLVERLRGSQPAVLVPLVAEMNSVLSIQTIETMFEPMTDAEGRPFKPFYLLNQFDATLPLQLDIREMLKQQLGERLLPFVIRRSPGVSEALAEGMTIVDYDSESAVVQDYLRVANWLRTLSASAQAGIRQQRWSEP